MASIAILRERRRIPDRIIEAQPDEPPVQHAVIQLLDQQPLAAKAIEHLEQSARNNCSGGIGGRPIVEYN